MSTQHVRSTIADFLASKAPQAIALTGQWGRGKTFFWDQSIAEAGRRQQFTKYAYVSLFGIGSLAELKAAIFENALSPTDLAGGATAETWKKNVEAFLTNDSAIKIVGGAANRVQSVWRWGRRHASQLLPSAGGWGTALRQASFLAVRDYVICLDDLERKGDGLSITEILGLVSSLKEQRKSRIIVILNDGALAEERDTFDGFREKVFDREVVFAPTPEECAALAFPKEWPHAQSATVFAIKLCITNIRVLQRIRTTIDAFYILVKNCEPSLLTSLVHSAVLLTWSYNSTLTDAPDYEFIKHITYFNSAGQKGKEEEGADRGKAWLGILQEYQFYTADEFDLQICRYLEDGYLSDDGELHNVIRRANEQAIEASAKGSFSGAWRLFHDTFADNEKSFIAAIRERFMSTAKWIDFNNADATISLIRELGNDGIADTMIDHWIKVNAEYNPQKLDISSLHFRSELRDERFNKAVAEANAKDKHMPTLSETIRRLAGKNGWSQIDELVMSQSSVDDYVQFFMGIELDDQLGSYIETCLQFGKFNNASNQQIKISRKASSALRQIAAQNRLNALRIARYPLLPDISED